MTSDDRTALRHSVPSSASTSPLLGRKQSRRRAHTLGGLLWFGRPRRQLQALLTSLPALAVVSVLITAVLVVVLRLRRKGEDMHAATDQAGVSDSVPAAYVAADLPSKHVSPSMELNSPVWNAFLRLGSASSDTINLQPRTTTFNAPDLDMARLHKQRLKPWSDFRVLGGAQCPAVNNECPHFTACRGNYNAGVETRPSKNSLSAVHFCTLGNVYDERHVEPIRAPRDVRGRMVSALVYSQSTLPWEGTLVAIAGRRVYTNALGQVFTRRVQYLHGGCQDLVDVEHGGERSYSPRSQNITVRQFPVALNLVHVYGDNFYHFLVEVLPRMYLASTLFKSEGMAERLPILLRRGSPVDLLRLLGLDPDQLNLHFISEEDELVETTEFNIITLAPRCLHAPRSLWRTMRKEWSKHLWERVDGLPDRFRMPLSYGQFVRDTMAMASGAPLSAAALPLVKLVYFSRRGLRRREVTDEVELINLLREALSLDGRVVGRVPMHALRELVDDEETTLDTNSEEPSTMTTYFTTSSETPAILSATLNNSNTSTFIPISLAILYGGEPLATTIRALAGATHVIGPHGAALANMVFVPARAQLWELAPAVQAPYFNPCFIYLAHALNIRHGLARAEKGTHTTELHMGEERRDALVRAIVDGVRTRQEEFRRLVMELKGNLRELVVE